MLGSRIIREKTTWLANFPIRSNCQQCRLNIWVLLSRFMIQDIDPVKDHLVVIISGPEPQRTMMENKIVRDISNYPGTAAIIRGLPEFKSIIPSTGCLRFYNHLGTDQLNEEIAKADLIICRSGYSTVMDIAKFK